MKAKGGRSKGSKPKGMPRDDQITRSICSKFNLNLKKVTPKRPRPHDINDGVNHFYDLSENKTSIMYPGKVGNDNYKVKDGIGLEMAIANELRNLGAPVHECHVKHDVLVRRDVSPLSLFDLYHAIFNENYDIVDTIFQSKVWRDSGRAIPKRACDRPRYFCHRECQHYLISIGYILYDVLEKVYKFIDIAKDKYNFKLSPDDVDMNGIMDFETYQKGSCSFIDAFQPTLPMFEYLYSRGMCVLVNPIWKEGFRASDWRSGINSVLDAFEKGYDLPQGGYKPRYEEWKKFMRLDEIYGANKPYTDFVSKDDFIVNAVRDLRISQMYCTNDHFINYGMDHLGNITLPMLGTFKCESPTDCPYCDLTNDTKVIASLADARILTCANTGVLYHPYVNLKSMDVCYPIGRLNRNLTVYHNKELVDHANTNGVKISAPGEVLTGGKVIDITDSYHSCPEDLEKDLGLYGKQQDGTGRMNMLYMVFHMATQVCSDLYSGIPSGTIKSSEQIIKAKGRSSGYPYSKAGNADTVREIIGHEQMDTLFGHFKHAMWPMFSSTIPKIQQQGDLRQRSICYGNPIQTGLGRTLWQRFNLAIKDKIYKSVFWIGYNKFKNWHVLLKTLITKGKNYVGKKLWISVDFPKWDRTFDPLRTFFINLVIFCSYDWNEFEREGGPEAVLNQVVADTVNSNYSYIYGDRHLTHKLSSISSGNAKTAHGNGLGNLILKLDAYSEQILWYSGKNRNVIELRNKIHELMALPFEELTKIDPSYFYEIYSDIEKYVGNFGILSDDSVDLVDSDVIDAQFLVKHYCVISNYYFTKAKWSVHDFELGPEEFCSQATIKIRNNPNPKEGEDEWEMYPRSHHISRLIAGLIWSNKTTNLRYDVILTKCTAFLLETYTMLYDPEVETKYKEFWYVVLKYVREHTYSGRLNLDFVRGFIPYGAEDFYEGDNSEFTKKFGTEKRYRDAWNIKVEHGFVPECGVKTETSESSSECYHLGKTKVTVVQGDLCNLSADVVVNPANPYLRHGGGVAGALLRAGGPTVNHESTNLVRCGGIPYGSVVSTTAGRLKYGQIYHAIVPTKDNKDFDQVLQDTLKNVYNKAISSGKKTIVIPGLCTGLYGCSVEKCAKIIVDSIKDCGLEEIILCDHTPAVIKEFKSNLSSIAVEAKFMSNRCVLCSSVKTIRCNDCGFDYCNVTDGHAIYHLINHGHCHWMAGRNVECNNCSESDINKLGSVGNIVFCFTCKSDAKPIVGSNYISTKLAIGSGSDPVPEEFDIFINALSLYGWYNPVTYVKAFKYGLKNPLFFIHSMKVYAKYYMKKAGENVNHDIVVHESGNVTLKFPISSHDVYNVMRYGKVYDQVTFVLESDGTFKPSMELKQGDSIRIERNVTSYVNAGNLISDSCGKLLYELISGTRKRIAEFEFNSKLWLGLNKFQQVAFTEGLYNNFTYVWGPPGTGKTTTMIALIKQFVMLGKTVCVAGPSHKAVDVLLNRFNKEMPGKSARNMTQNIEKIRTDCPSFGKGLRSKYAVVGTTLQSMPKGLTCDVIIIDEYGMCENTDLVSALMNANFTQAVFSGDPKQLSCRHYFDVPNDYVNFANYWSQSGNGCVQLKKQFRMGSAIGNWISRTFYDGKLETGRESVGSIKVISHDGKPAYAGKGCYSEGELDVTRGILDRLRKEGIKDVSVLCPYGIQVARYSRDLYPSRVCTIDSAQGSESEVVILLLPNIGSHSMNRNRFNVAISRARDRVYIVTNNPSGLSDYYSFDEASVESYTNSDTIFYCPKDKTKCACGKLSVLVNGKCYDCRDVKVSKSYYHQDDCPVCQKELKVYYADQSYSISMPTPSPGRHEYFKFKSDWAVVWNPPRYKTADYGYELAGPGNDYFSRFKISLLSIRGNIKLTPYRGKVPTSVFGECVRKLNYSETELINHQLVTKHYDTDPDTTNALRFIGVDFELVQSAENTKVFTPFEIGARSWKSSFAQLGNPVFETDTGFVKTKISIPPPFRKGPSSYVPRLAKCRIDFDVVMKSFVEWCFDQVPDYPIFVAYNDDMEKRSIFPYSKFGEEKCHCGASAYWWNSRPLCKEHCIKPTHFYNPQFLDVLEQGLNCSECHEKKCKVVHGSAHVAMADADMAYCIAKHKFTCKRSFMNTGKTYFGIEKSLKDVEYLDEPSLSELKPGLYFGTHFARKNVCRFGDLYYPHRPEIEPFNEIELGALYSYEVLSCNDSYYLVRIINARSEFKMPYGESDKPVLNQEGYFDRKKPSFRTVKKANLILSELLAYDKRIIEGPMLVLGDSNGTTSPMCTEFGKYLSCVRGVDLQDSDWHEHYTLDVRDYVPDIQYLYMVSDLYSSDCSIFKEVERIVIDGLSPGGDLFIKVTWNFNDWNVLNNLAKSFLGFSIHKAPIGISSEMWLHFSGFLRAPLQPVDVERSYYHAINYFQTKPWLAEVMSPTERTLLYKNGAGKIVKMSRMHVNTKTCAERCVRNGLPVGRVAALIHQSYLGLKKQKYEELQNGIVLFYETNPVPKDCVPLMEDIKKSLDLVRKSAIKFGIKDSSSEDVGTWCPRSVNFDQSCNSCGEVAAGLFNSNGNELCLGCVKPEWKKDVPEWYYHCFEKCNYCMYGSWDCNEFSTLWGGKWFV